MTDTDETMRILHVDDEPGFADMATSFLEREDGRLEVQTATSAAAGLTILADDDIDCVVSDYDMPDRNGIQFLEAVREEYDALPFILFTGKGSEEIASDAISAGVTDYLQKGSGTDQYAVLANRITNAVESQRVKRERNRQLDAIETAQEGISILDEDGQFIFVNEAYADLYGYDPDEMVGEHWELLYQEEDIPRIYEEIIPTVEENGYWTGTTTGLRADGSTFTEDHVLALTDRGELVCTVRDISNQRDGEQELTRIKRAMDEAPIGITITGLGQEDTPITYANSRFLELTGYAESEVCGRNCRFLQGEGTESEPVDAMRAAIDADEPVSVELRNYRKDGTMFWSQVSIAPVRDDDGTVDSYVGFQQDITERKEHERRLRALSESVQNLIRADTRKEVAEIGVETARTVLGLEASTIHLYNETEQTLEPVAASDAIYDLVPDLPTFTPGDSIAWRVYESGDALAVDDVHADPDIYNPDTRIKSELYLPLDEHGILLAGSKRTAAFDQRDIVLGEILAGHVTSALKQVEGTEQLRDREQDLKQHNDRLEAFTSIVSHDLRNPLNVAQGRLQLAREQCESEHLAAVERAHERMDTLIADLLTLARDGETVTDREPVALASLVDSCWTTVETADATLTTDIDRTVLANESRLKQLFENLVRNAIEHAGSDVTVTVGALDDGFYVADDGPGIPEADRETVFEVGYSTNTDGTGFGLCIAKQVAEAHGWEIRVRDSADGGARFEVTGVSFRDA
ncbi:PAS domain S-box protein [Haloarcula sp. CBA1130]|uniref:hybrid sensor histidine kinase/response regulator n=1 Tax=unclassified Haloarcula TaxID=2624677 RepID=UPI001243EF25|nr:MULTISPECIES: PAS domain S-box protein [unclassified Haloarcula]KAA9397362.1 PAS domain S-box protein [Haloarcula sp. CBA1129]KAA9402604.1 PAS domain S-box protein [Haloarcula sp. CBA1130]